jgi:hypothetical protein
MRGAIFPLPSKPSWHDTQLKKSTGTTLPLMHTILSSHNKFSVTSKSLKWSSNSKLLQKSHNTYFMKGCESR